MGFILVFGKLIAAEKAFSPHIIVSYLDVPTHLTYSQVSYWDKSHFRRKCFLRDFSRYDWTPPCLPDGAILSRFADMVIANSYAGKNIIYSTVIRPKI